MYKIIKTSKKMNITRTTGIKCGDELADVFCKGSGIYTNYVVEFGPFHPKLLKYQPFTMQGELEKKKGE